MSEPVRYRYEIGGTLDAIIIDATSTEALLARKNEDGGDVFWVDTTNERTHFGDSNFYATFDGTDSFIHFATSNDYLRYNRTDNTFHFTIASIDRFTIDNTFITSEIPHYIDTTSTEAFLVRKDSDGGDVFTVDTSGSIIEAISSSLTIYGNKTAGPFEGGAYFRLIQGGYTYTDDTTAGSGTAASNNTMGIGQMTLAASNASVTTTDASSLYIDGPPLAGTNQTITNSYSLLVNDGTSRFNTEVSLNNETYVRPYEIKVDGTDPLVNTFTLTTKFPSSVVAYYDFAKQNNLGRDVSGNSLHAKPYSLIYTATEASRDNVIEYGQTAGNTGNDVQRLDIPDIYKFQSLDNCTISLWFKSSYASAGEAALLSFSSDTHASTDFSIYLSSTKLFVQHRVSGTVNFQNESTSAVNDDSWHNVIVRLGSSTVSVYIDDVEQTTYNTGSTSSTESLDDFTITHMLLGANYNDSGYRYGFNGFLADLIIFNEQVSATIMTNLSNDDYGYDVYALMGQSNMVGRGDVEEGIDDDYTIVSGKVYQFPYDVNDSGTAGAPNVDGTTISAATNPLDHISDPTGGSSGEQSGDTGIWKTFTETIINTISARRKILLIPAAKGSTGFVSFNWNPGNVIYDAATQAVNQGMSTNPLNTLKAILWVQGESDSGQSPVTYGGLFENFYENLVTDITDFNTSVPFFIGGIKNVNADIFNPHLKNLAQPDNNRYFITTDGLSTTDGTHYDAASLRTYGIRFANSYLRTLYTSYQSEKKQIVESSLQLKDTTESGLVVSNDSSDILKVDTHNSKVYINNAEVLAVNGDITLTTFNGANNQASAVDVTGLAFPEATVQSFMAYVTIIVDATADVYEQFQLRGLQKATGTWVLSANSMGDVSNIIFTITSSGGNGQIQYTSDNYSGFVSLVMKFRAWVN